MGIASLTLSIIAILFCLMPIVGVVISLIALVIAIVAKCIKKNKEMYYGIKLTGLIISIIAMSISTIITGIFVANTYYVLKQKDKNIDELNTEAAIEDNESKLKTIVELEWASQYIENIAEGIKPTYESIYAAKDVKEKLDEMNKNKNGIKYELVVDATGVIIQKRDANGKLIKTL